MAKFEAPRTDLRRAETGGGPGRGGATAKGMKRLIQTQPGSRRVTSRVRETRGE